jgi:mRNA interferase RelE/StbE
MSPPRWELRAAPAAREQLDCMPLSTAAAVLETLDAIASERRRSGKQLRFELEGCFSAPRGPYRVIYRIDEHPPGAVSVIAVTHRGAHG